MKLTAAATLTFTCLLIGTGCGQRQAARTNPPLRPPEQQTEVRALPANSSPNLKLVIDGANLGDVIRVVRSKYPILEFETTSEQRLRAFVQGAETLVLRGELLG